MAMLKREVSLKALLVFLPAVPSTFTWEWAMSLTLNLTSFSGPESLFAEEEVSLQNCQQRVSEHVNRTVLTVNRSIRPYLSLGRLCGYQSQVKPLAKSP
jgi:hypothetical protein